MAKKVLKAKKATRLRKVAHSMPLELEKIISVSRTVRWLSV